MVMASEAMEAALGAMSLSNSYTPRPLPTRRSLATYSATSLTPLACTGTEHELLASSMRYVSLLACPRAAAYMAESFMSEGQLAI